MDKKMMIKELFDSGTISRIEYNQMIERIESNVSLENLVTQVYAFEKYLKENYSKHTCSGYVSNTKKYFEFMTGSDFDEILPDSTIVVSIENIQKWLNSLGEKGYNSVSIRRYKNSISKFLVFLKENYKINTPNLCSVSVPETSATKEELDVLTDVEVRKIACTAQNKRDKLIILLIYELGLKRQELIDLRRTDIDKVTRRVNIILNSKIDRVGKPQMIIHFSFKHGFYSTTEHFFKTVINIVGRNWFIDF